MQHSYRKRISLMQHSYRKRISLTGTTINFFKQLVLDYLSFPFFVIFLASILVLAAPFLTLLFASRSLASAARGMVWIDKKEKMRKSSGYHFLDTHSELL
jgi:hypothetical protein